MGFAPWTPSKAEPLQSIRLRSPRRSPGLLHAFPACRKLRRLVCSDFLYVRNPATAAQHALDAGSRLQPDAVRRLCPVMSIGQVRHALSAGRTSNEPADRRRASLRREDLASALPVGLEHIMNRQGRQQRQRQHRWQSLQPDYGGVSETGQKALPAKHMQNSSQRSRRPSAISALNRHHPTALAVPGRHVCSVSAPGCHYRATRHQSGSGLHRTQARAPIGERCGSRHRVCGGKTP